MRQKRRRGLRVEMTASEPEHGERAERDDDDLREREQPAARATRARAE